VTTPRTASQLRSLVTEVGTLTLSLKDVEVPTPTADQVVVRVEAAPINPSDLGLLLAGADLSTLQSSGTAREPVVTGVIPANVLRTLAGRFDQSLAVGNEGGGVVVDAGSSAGAQSLVGKTVGLFGGSMYTEYRTVDASMCLEMPEGTLPSEAASCFVNPLTALGMVETMRLEGHTALVHTAAASNLGQMLVKICIDDGVPLVNIVRRAEQVSLLESIGAKYVVDSSASTFMADLTEALGATGATLAFDAIGGGRLAGQILTAMEAAANAKATEYSRYGSTTYKQLYIYGGLDRSPTEFNRTFGMVWGMGGWLLMPFLQKVGPEVAQRMRRRVAAEIKTTFASSYAAEVSLAEALTLDAISVYGTQSTGAKYLINPNA
jgi:NADPH2:quinone reductase